MRHHDWIRAQYHDIEVRIQPALYKLTAQYQMVKIAISLIKSRLWAKNNMQDEVHMFMYDLDDPYPEDLIRHREREENNGVHEAHCCKEHGCKYGDDECPVVLGLSQQRYPCEECDEKVQKNVIY